MTWSNDPPTVPGYWWCLSSDGPRPAVVFVHPGPHGRLWAWRPVESVPYVVSDMPGSRWAGPLTPPGEPAATGEG